MPLPYAITDADYMGYQTRQFDALRGRGESMLAHLANPPATAVAAEDASVARAQERGVVGATGQALSADASQHRDRLKAEWDSTQVAPVAREAQRQAQQLRARGATAADRAVDTAERRTADKRTATAKQSEPKAAKKTTSTRSSKRKSSGSK